jgi:phage shock protein PspC (stress-responsive transcriptional regulator)
MAKINLLEHVYDCTDEAAQRLNKYLAEIQRVFKEQTEVIRDIELGLIEQLDVILSERVNQELNLLDIEFVIQKMGDVHQFQEFEQSTETITTKQNFYRDYDNRIIAGVCSGIGAYFNLSNWLIRLIFIFCFFTPLPVFITYILMWYLIPPALTKSEKLNMKGIPVNINTIADTNQHIRKQILHLAKLVAIALAIVTFIGLCIVSFFYFI